MKKYFYTITCIFFIYVLVACDKKEELPAISRTVIMSYGPDFAEVQGRIYLSGSSPITRSGICYSLKSTDIYDEDLLEFPTLDDNVQEGDLKEPGLYNMRVKDLMSDTVYYIRLFAENENGVFYSYPARVKTGKIYDDLIFVESGEFTMGSAIGEIDAMPIHNVILTNNIYISTNEVTNAEYCDFLNESKIASNGYSGNELWIDMASDDVPIYYDGDRFIPKAGAENKPAICITWYGAQAYCAYRGGRLPTEAEWEFIANGGNNKSGYIYSGSDVSEEVGWFNVTNLQNVGLKKCNTLGIYDMSGNVAEWCGDWYSENAYEESLEKDPEGPKNGNQKVIRGGSYNQNPISITTRNHMDPKTASPFIGFRVVVVLSIRKY